MKKQSTSPHFPPSLLSVWWLTIRPKTLTATVIPVVVASMLALADTGSIDIAIALCCLAFGLCIQIATNFFNDVEDWRKGADNPHRLGPRRAIQQGVATPQQVAFAALSLLFFAALLALPLVAKGGVPMALLAAISMLLSYCYTGGAMPLAYKGLGEVFVMLFFGLAATVMPYHLQTGSFSLLTIVAALQVGLFSTNLLAVNNLRDISTDKAVGKKTLAVRFGDHFARLEIAFCCMAPFFLLPIWYVAGFAWAALLPLALFPLANRLVNNISSTPVGAAAYSVFFAQAGLLHLLFGLALAIGILL